MASLTDLIAATTHTTHIASGAPTTVITGAQANYTMSVHPHYHHAQTPNHHQNHHYHNHHLQSPHYQHHVNTANQQPPPPPLPQTNDKQPAKTYYSSIQDLNQFYFLGGSEDSVDSDAAAAVAAAAAAAVTGVDPNAAAVAAVAGVLTAQGIIQNLELTQSELTPKEIRKITWSCLERQKYAFQPLLIRKNVFMEKKKATHEFSFIAYESKY